MQKLNTEGFTFYVFMDNISLAQVLEMIWTLKALIIIKSAGVMTSLIIQR